MYRFDFSKQDSPTALVVGAHPDDLELSMGGTVAKMASFGWRIASVMFTDCAASLPIQYTELDLKKERKAAALRLGISLIEGFFEGPCRNLGEFRQEVLEDLRTIIDQYRPALIFCPNSHDTRQDHMVVHSETLRASKVLPSASIYGYVAPWNNMVNDCSFVVELNAGHAHRKLDAIREYRSQEHRAYCKDEVTMAHLMAVASRYGLMPHALYAEEFQVLRQVSV